jgi:hypothetical protein
MAKEQHLSLPETIGGGRYVEKHPKPRHAMTTDLFWSIRQFFTLRVPILYG